MDFSSDSSSATQIICSPSGPYFFCNSTSHGSSILQGSHHVAQKFTITPLPFKEESCMVLPFSPRTFKVKSGAMSPFLGARMDVVCWLAWVESWSCRPSNLPLNSKTVMATTTHRTKSNLLFTRASQGKFV